MLSVHLDSKKISWINVYTRKVSGSKICFLVLYVDDILLATNDKGLLYKVKQFLFKNFEMKDIGDASYIIGIKIHRDRFRDVLDLS